MRHLGNYLHKVVVIKRRMLAKEINNSFPFSSEERILKLSALHAMNAKEIEAEFKSKNLVFPKNAISSY